jgi:hypothetical protein
MYPFGSPGTALGSKLVLRAPIPRVIRDPDLAPLTVLSLSFVQLSEPIEPPSLPALPCVYVNASSVKMNWVHARAGGPAGRRLRLIGSLPVGFCFIGH